MESRVSDVRASSSPAVLGSGDALGQEGPHLVAVEEQGATRQGPEHPLIHELVHRPRPAAQHARDFLRPHLRGPRLGRRRGNRVALAGRLRLLPELLTETGLARGELGGRLHRARSIRGSPRRPSRRWRILLGLGLIQVTRNDESYTPGPLALESWRAVGLIQVTRNDEVALPGTSGTEGTRCEEFG